MNKQKLTNLLSLEGEDRASSHACALEALGEGDSHRNKLFPLNIFLTLILLFCLPLSAPGAAEFSGKYLLHVCSSDKAGNELVKGGHTACQAYIAGLIDYHTMIKSLKTAPGLDFCIPKDVSLAVVQEGIVMYLLRNGQHDDFIASPAVAIALNQMYPCKTRKKKK